MEDEKTILQKGWDWIDRIHGETGRGVLRNLSLTSPEMVDYIVGFGYGQVYENTTLDVRRKQLAIVAALCALGHAPSQLKVHMRATINIGCTPEEIHELILQLSVYCGFPAAMNAMMQLKALAEEMGLAREEGEHHSLRLDEQKGEQILEQLVPGQMEKFEKHLGTISPELIQMTTGYAFGAVYNRKALSPADRELIIIAALGAMGTCEQQLKWHLQAAINLGISLQQLKDIIHLLILYSGFPAAMNAMAVLKSITNED